MRYTIYLWYLAGDVLHPNRRTSFVGSADYARGASRLVGSVVHSTGVSLWFVVVYFHIFRGLMYGSYKTPRVTVEVVWFFYSC